MLNVSLHHKLRTVSGYSIGRIKKKKNHNTIFGLNRLLKKKKKQKDKNKNKNKGKTKQHEKIN